MILLKFTIVTLQWEKAILYKSSISSVRFTEADIHAYGFG